jgi:hypothetical protein
VRLSNAAEFLRESGEQDFPGKNGLTSINESINMRSHETIYCRSSRRAPQEAEIPLRRTRNKHGGSDTATCSGIARQGRKENKEVISAEGGHAGSGKLPTRPDSAIEETYEQS